MTIPVDSVSVVIPLYNHERYIRQALESALGQSHPPLEVIVVDDGSSDGSTTTAQEVALRHPGRIVLWSQPNQGAHQAINNGIARARGTFIAILNSDDVWDAERLRHCLEAKADIVATGIRFVGAEGEAKDNPWYEEAKAFYRKEGDLALALINGNFLMTTSNLFIRRTLARDLRGFANLRYAHDLDFFLRALLGGHSIRLLEEPLLSYRTHDSNTISEGVMKVKAEWAMVTAAFLWRRMMQRGQDWSYYARLTDITDRHNLTRMVVFALAFLAGRAPEEQGCDALAKNPDFLRFLQEAAR